MGKMEIVMMIGGAYDFEGWVNVQRVYLLRKS